MLLRSWKAFLWRIFRVYCMTDTSPLINANALKNATYFRNKLYKNRTFVIVTYLRIVAKLCLIIEDVQIRITVLGWMQIGSVNDRSYVLSVRKSFQRLVPYIDWMLNGPFPISVLVNNRRQDFGKVVAVRVFHEASQDLSSSIGFDSILKKL